MAKQAYLSASASQSFTLACPSSVKLCEGMEYKPSTFAQEGTACHELCAYLVEKAMEKDVANPTEN